MQRGYIGGLNYQLPQQFIGQQPLEQVDPMQVEGPASAVYTGQNPKLAQRGKLTGDYFNTYGRLDAYVKSMLKQGIDPTIPDYTQEDGGLPFQMFQQLQAGLMHSANNLSNELEFQKQAQPYLLENKIGIRQGVDPNSMWAQNPDSFYSKGLTPGTQEMNRRLGEQFYTPGGAQRSNDRIQHFMSVIDDQVARGVLTPEEGEIQKQAIVPSVHENKQFAPPRDTSASAKNQFYKDFLKDVTNWTLGVWPDGSYSRTNVRGVPYAENTKRSGEIMGYITDEKGERKPKILKRLLKNQAGQVFAEYTDPSIPMERTDNQRGDKWAYSLISNNDKYGGTAAVPTASQVWQEAGFMDDQRNVINATQLVENSDAISGASVTGLDSYSVDDEIEALRQKLDDEAIGILTNDDVDIQLPGGRKMVIKPQGSGGSYKIKNSLEFRDILPDQRQRKKELSFEELVDVLERLGYWADLAQKKNQGTNVAPYQSTPVQDRAAQIKAK